ncbi:MAG: MFS transporter [Nodosilinea sp.]
MLREFDSNIMAGEVDHQETSQGREAQSESGQDPTTSDPALLNHQAIEELETEGFASVLRNRNFVALWLGQLFSQLSDKVYLVLIIAIISTQFEAPGQTISGWVAAVMIAFTIPAVLFGALAGVFVDRWPKRSVLVLSNLFRGLLVAVLPLLLWLTASWSPFLALPVGFWLLLTITFVISTLTQFFAPAEQAMIPIVVEQRDLLSANSLYTTTMMASVIVGFAVGEPVLALGDRIMATLGFHQNGSAILVGLSYLVAGLCLMRVVPSPEALAMNRDVSQIWTDIGEGLAYLKRHAQVRVAVLQLILLSCVFAALSVLAVRLAELIPTLKASQFGFLLAAGGVGLALGAILVGNFGQRFLKRYLSLWGALGMAASLVALGWTTEKLWLSMGLIATIGLCGALIGIPMQTLIQQKTPEAMRGKVFGLQNNFINIALTLPLALASVVETHLGLSHVFMGLGVLVGIGGVVTWYIADTAMR